MLEGKNIHANMLQQPLFSSLSKAKTWLINSVRQQVPNNPKTKMSSQAGTDSSTGDQNTSSDQMPSPHLNALRELCKLDVEEERRQSVKSNVWSRMRRLSRKSVGEMLRHRIDTCWQHISNSSLFIQLSGTYSTSNFSENNLRPMASAKCEAIGDDDNVFKSRSNLSIFSENEENTEPLFLQQDNESNHFTFFRQSSSLSKSMSLYKRQDINQVNTGVSKKIRKLTAGSVDASSYAHICLQYFVESKQLRVIFVQADNLPDTKSKVYTKLCLKLSSKCQNIKSKSVAVKDQVARFLTEMFFSNCNEDDLSEMELIVCVYKQRWHKLRSKFICGVILPLGDLDLQMDTTMRVGLQTTLTKQIADENAADIEILSHDRSLWADAAAAISDDYLVDTTDNRSKLKLRRCRSLPVTGKYQLNKK